MAQLVVQSDPLVPGRWTVQSEHPGALAAVPDAIVQVTDGGADVLSARAVHYDEQNEYAENAYANERRELGHGPVAEVVALPRAPEPNKVWIDRQHLVVGAAPPRLATRLLGLYVGSNGSITLAVSDPSVAAQVHATLRAQIEAPPDTIATWDSEIFVSLNRFVVRYDALSLHGEKRTDVVQVRASQQMALTVQNALLQLQQLVAGW
ncbi:MAG: hypothetical protein KDC46_12575 [Thermoleophilia bacterium]|nr:hypothetical protein [Thermoleophilia bacterium]